MAIEELQELLNIVKNMARVHSKWLIRYTTIHMGRLDELILVMTATNAHKVRSDKGKSK